MRQLLAAEQSKVGLLVGTNASLAGIHVWIDKVTPYLNFGLVVIQIAIGVATVIYTVKKIINRKKKNAKRISSSH